jgi:deglycase
MGKLTGQKIAFVIAPKDFRDEEYFQPKVVLQAQGALIDTICKGDPEEVTGSKGGKAHTNALFADLKSENYAGVVFVGGEGVKEYWNDKKVHKIAQDFDQAEKLVGAICSAPVILAKAGILEDRTVTSFIDDKAEIEAEGVKWVDKTSLIDGHIVTSKGPGVAMLFGQDLLKVLIK